MEMTDTWQEINRGFLNFNTTLPESSHHISWLRPAQVNIAPHPDMQEWIEEMEREKAAPNIREWAQAGFAKEDRMAVEARQKAQAEVDESNRTRTDGGFTYLRSIL